MENQKNRTPVIGNPVLQINPLENRYLILEVKWKGTSTYAVTSSEVETSFKVISETYPSGYYAVIDRITNQILCQAMAQPRIHGDDDELIGYCSRLVEQVVEEATTIFIGKELIGYAHKNIITKHHFDFVK